MRVLLVIPSFDPGGCERQVAALAGGLVGAGHTVGVAVFSSGGEFEAGVITSGVEILDLEKGALATYPVFLTRLVRRIRSWKPDIVYGFLGTPNALLALCRPLMGGVPLVWGVRATDFIFSDYPLRSRIMTKLESVLSAVPNLIVTNSITGKRDAIGRGFPSERVTVIPNGIDANRFKPDALAGKALRQSWGVDKEQVLVGMAARIDPMKDHGTFLKAASLLSADHSEYRFVCVGGGDESYEISLMELAKSLNLNNVLTWAGYCQDMPAVHNALDICCLSSAYGEGFPNSVGEAMSSGTPCVVTDSGDAAMIVGATGESCVCGDETALAAAIEKMAQRIHTDRMGTALACRKRIVEIFSVERMVESTEAMLLSLL